MFVGAVKDINDLLYGHKDAWISLVAYRMMMFGYMDTFIGCKWEFGVEGVGEDTKFCITCCKECDVS